MKNRVGDQEAPLAKSVWTNKREGRVRSGAEAGGIKSTAPLRFSNHRLTNAGYLVKIHTCPCGVQNHRRRTLFKVVPEAYYTKPLINLGFTIVGQSSIVST